MAKVVFGMTMSLDGYINDRKRSVARLYPDLGALRQTEMLRQAIRTTGAVLMGRRTYEMANGDFTGYEFQVPIFVVTHRPPREAARGENENLKFNFVSDGLEKAVARARTAAGQKNVTVVGGPDMLRQMLKAGLVDELEIGIMPVLLGGGKKLFEASTLGPIELEQVSVTAPLGATHIRYRIAKPPR
jgi:dihydrofolate reductase